MKPLTPVRFERYGINVIPLSGFAGCSQPPKSAQYILSELEKEKELGKVTDYASGPGFVSLALSKFCDKVVSVEWNLTAYRTLKDNISANCLNNVTPVLSDGFKLSEKSDSVIVNPDPHGGRELTISMFENSLSFLKENGKLFFICRRDFGAKWYQKYLKNLFEEVEVLGISGGYRTLRCCRKKNFTPGDFSRKINFCQNVFKTVPGVFSRKKIDEGTKHLIENVSPTTNSSVIDFGCGYGPIGICLSKTAEKCFLIENNLIAVKCSWKNAGINSAGNCEVIFDDRVPERLYASADYFLSNPPTHFGGNAADFILGQAFLSLKKGGTAAFVVHRTAGYAQRMKHIFKNVSSVEKGFYTVLISEKC